MKIILLCYTIYITDREDEEGLCNSTGNFKLEELGVGNIYIHENRSPYIVIKTENRYYIINYKDSKKTIDLYNKLR